MQILKIGNKSSLKLALLHYEASIVLATLKNVYFDFKQEIFTAVQYISHQQQREIRHKQQNLYEKFAYR